MNERVTAAKASGAKGANPVPVTQNTVSPQPTNSSVDQILFLQRTIGNQAVERLFKSGIIQAKFKIGEPNDIYEQEADRVANIVVRMPEPAVQMNPG